MAGTASVAVANVRMSSSDVAHCPSEIEDIYIYICLVEIKLYFVLLLLFF